MVILVTFVKVSFLLSLFVHNWKPWLCVDVDSVESCMQNWFQNFEIFVTLVQNIFYFVQSVKNLRSVRITHAGSLHSSYNPDNTELIVTILHSENVKHCPICLKMKWNTVE